MRQILLVSALAILAWDSVAAMLETQDLKTGIKTQYLFQHEGCEAAREKLMAKPGFNHAFSVSECTTKVWLPWEESSEYGTDKTNPFSGNVYP